MGEDSRQRALQLLQEGRLELSTLWIWFVANGGGADEIDFDAALMSPDGWSPFDLKMLGWAIEDALSHS